MLSVKRMFDRQWQNTENLLLEILLLNLTSAVSHEKEKIQK